MNVNLNQQLVKLAIIEGGRKLSGNENKAGLDIEKYLAVFRPHLASINSKYSNTEIGFEWCCAYVYYLLQKIDYKIDIVPLPSSNAHLGAVRTWYEYAKLKEMFFIHAPMPGDLVLFDSLIEQVELDHIGIVIENGENYIITSEGNYHNKAGIFKRKKDDTIKGYIRL